MISVCLLGIGLRGPGLNGWADGAKVLRGETDFTNNLPDIPLSEKIPARERRRLSSIVRLALSVADEATMMAGVDATDIGAVFGWPHGDTGIIQNILKAICTEDRIISPTEFHNSVHNVAVGYWSMYTGCQMPCTSISAEIDTFAAALIKTAIQIDAQERPVLMTITDAPFAEPLNSVCPILEPFAAAFLLAPAPGPSDGSEYAGVEIDLIESPVKTDFTPGIDDLRELYQHNAAARSLPLLECLAKEKDADFVLPYSDQGGVRVTLKHR